MNIGLVSRPGKASNSAYCDWEDGGCKADKSERDIRLLTQGTRDEPDNVRYFFYLAHSYLAKLGFKVSVFGNAPANSRHSGEGCNRFFTSQPEMDSKFDILI